jgi:hypothetical protein
MATDDLKPVREAVKAPAWVSTTSPPAPAS